MLLPMGLPPDVRVIAWGLSLERLVTPPILHRFFFKTKSFLNQTNHD